MECNSCVQCQAWAVNERVNGRFFFRGDILTCKRGVKLMMAEFHFAAFSFRVLVLCMLHHCHVCRTGTSQMPAVEKAC